MSEIACFLIRFEKRNLRNFVVKKFGEENMTQFMYRSAEPRGPQNSFPADSLVIIILCAFLQFGENISENKKYSKRGEELDSKGFEESEEEGD